MKHIEDGVVLIVEDDFKLAELNRKILEAEGCTTLIANTLEEARMYLGMTDPDLVVLDIMLPDGSGLELSREILDSGSNAQVVFLTTMREKSDVITGFKAGGVDYIKKPYDISEFCLRVMKHLSTACELRKHKVSAANTAALTKRELAVAVLAAEGMSNKEIADEVYLSESRVKGCLNDIYAKLNITEDKRKTLAEILR